MNVQMQMIQADLMMCARQNEPPEVHCNCENIVVELWSHFSETEVVLTHSTQTHLHQQSSDENLVRNKLREDSDI
jgi:hypothetical protein